MNVQFDFSDRIALVTGAASGIGAATARAFAAAGAQVVLADIDAAGMQTICSEIANAGGHADVVACDIAEEEQVAALVETIVARHGRLDYAHNNAGVDGPQVPLHEYPVTEWDRLVRINLRGTFLCLQAELRQMLAQGGGAIVNTASIAAASGALVLAGPYTASKHGLAGLTKVAAVAYASAGIRINAVCPSFVQTPMLARALEGNPDEAQEVLDRIIAVHPLGRLGTAEEIASAVLWLCSDAASFVTGAILPVDGGRLAR